MAKYNKINFSQDGVESLMKMSSDLKDRYDDYVEAKNRLEKLRDNMTYLELSGMVEFNNAYMEHMMFPEE